MKNQNSKIRIFAILSLLFAPMFLFGADGNNEEIKNAIIKFLWVDSMGSERQIYVIVAQVTFGLIGFYKLYKDYISKEGDQKSIGKVLIPSLLIFAALPASLTWVVEFIIKTFLS